MRTVHLSSGGGFTLIEVLTSIAIMGIIVGMVFINYGTFTSRSLLRVRIAEMGEYVRFAQEKSGSAENFSKNAVLPTEGFQVVRVKVRNGMLTNIRLEKAPGAFTSFAESTNFSEGRDSDVPGSRQVIIETAEKYFVDVCFIDEGGSPRYARKKLVVKGDTSCSSDSMLCSTPNPIGTGYDATQTTRNNFDIHFSVEQPSRAVHANVVPVTITGGTETYQYAGTEPNGASARISDKYEGVRIVFITEKGYLRSIDMFKTGLIGFKAKDGDAGCG